MKFKGAKGMLILFCLIVMLAAYYCYLSNRNIPVKDENEVISRVQEVLARDLSRNYPATPKEVLKYYSELTQCFYNEEYTDQELAELSDKAIELYDDELVNAKLREEYLRDLKKDIADFEKDDIVISSYKVSNSTDVEYFTKDGRDCASLYCTYTLRKGTNLQATEEVFVLRKDAKGHWKILGFDVVKDNGDQK